MPVDLDELYAILRIILRTKDTITYQQLTDAYYVRKGYKVGVREWSTPLYEVSARCTAAGLPPISTIVVRSDDGLPGDGYWGIPGAPPTRDEKAWRAVLQAVYAARWPSALP